MSVTLALVVGGLTSVGVYLITSRSLTRMLLGFALLGHAAVLALLAAAILVNTSLLRLIAEHSRFAALHAIGFPRTSLAMAAAVENLMLVGTGALLGLSLAVVGGGPTGQILADYLPYVPAGSLVEIPAGVAVVVLGGALVLSLVTSLVPAFRLRRLGDLTALRGS